MPFEAEFRAAVKDFIKVARAANVEICREDLKIEVLRAPHLNAGSWQKGRMALYAFHHKNRWLKIGIAGPKSASRFYHHHYSPINSVSSLSRSIMLDPKRHKKISNDNVGGWVKKHCTRINILIPAEKGMPLLRLLEAYMHVRFLPYYERKENS